VPPSHHKPAPRAPSDAARKPATSLAAEGTAAETAAVEVGSSAEAASAVTPKVSAGVSPSVSGKAAKGKAGSRPTERKVVPVSRRGRSLVRVGRSSTLRNIYSYLRAYVPLFIAFAILFAGVWAWTSFGPHTDTPKESWTKIETNWKPKRAADLQAVSAAVAANDFNAVIKGYTAVRDDTKGWMDELAKVTSWDDANASPSATQSVTATQFVQQLIQDGKTEVGVLDQVAAAKSMDGILALKDQLDAADQALQGDFGYAPTIFGGAPAASGEPTLALPSGSLSPSGSPTTSAVPGSSAAPSPAVSASATPS
jgi:hypothetical protein